MVATNSQPVTLAETLDRIEATWRDWVLALEAVDPARRAEPGVCGWWSVKDLMAHIALWESVVPEHIQRWRLGLPEADHDVDLMNAEIVAENHNRSHALVRVDMHRAHQIALAAIREIDRDLDDDVRGADRLRDVGSLSGTYRAGPRLARRKCTSIAGGVMNESNVSKQYADRVAPVLAAAMNIPADRREQPGVCGEWSIKDLLGHLAYWDEVRIARLEADAAGRDFRKTSARKT